MHALVGRLKQTIDGAPVTRPKVDPIIKTARGLN